VIAKSPTVEKPRAVRHSGDDRRRQIVDAVLDLLAEVGESGVSTPAIAERLGVAQSAIFKHFRSKADIWAAVTEALGAQVGARVERAFATPTAPAIRYSAILEAYLSAAQDLPAIPALLFGAEVQSQRVSPLRETIRRRFGLLRAALADAARAGVEAGALGAGLDVEAFADLGVTLAQGLLVAWQLSERRLDMPCEARRLCGLLWSL